MPVCLGALLFFWLLQAGRAALPQLMLKTTVLTLCHLCSLCTYVYRAKRHKGEQSLKEQNKACFFACATLHHPASPIFIT